MARCYRKSLFTSRINDWSSVDLKTQVMRPAGACFRTSRTSWSLSTYTPTLSKLSFSPIRRRRTREDCLPRSPAPKSTIKPFSFLCCSLPYVTSLKVNRSASESQWLKSSPWRSSGFNNKILKCRVVRNDLQSKFFFGHWPKKIKSIRSNIVWKRKMTESF